MRVIMLTGYPTVETAREAISLGADEYCVKPIDRLELEEKGGKGPGGAAAILNKSAKTMVSMQTTDDPGSANGGPSREHQFLAVFQKVTRLTSQALDHQEVMDTIARGLPELLAIDACTIRLIDASIGLPARRGPRVSLSISPMT